jgi:antitoxin (DNA-binding transcriptional repressor) of toxin-antitoxin stability system
MKTATVRELRVAFPRVEAWLAEGESVLITKAGKPVAQLVQPPAREAKPDFASRYGLSERKVPKATLDMREIVSEGRGE